MKRVGDVRDQMLPVSEGCSVLGLDLLRAYRETHYVVEARAADPLLVGIPNAWLLAAFAGLRISCGAFLTVCNPHSQLLTEAANVERHQSFLDGLTKLGIPFLEGEGRHPCNGWPPEPSVFLWGVELGVGCAIGRRWQQNAFVWVGRDGIPQLVLLR
jgi:hypothetical protein